MLVVKMYHRILARIINLQSYNAYSSITSLNHRTCNLWYTEVRTLCTVHNIYKYKANFAMRKTANPLLKVDDAPTHFKSTDLQQKRCLGIAAKLVNNTSSKVQPYMKLMRIDKPIGKIQIFGHFLMN